MVANLSPVFSATSGLVASKVVFPEILQAELTSFHQLQSVLRASMPSECVFSRKFGTAASATMLMTNASMYRNVMAFER